MSFHEAAVVEQVLRDSVKGKILAAVIGKRPNPSGWVRVNCPVCPERIGKIDKRGSLGFRPKTGGFKCFKCGVRGRMEGKQYVLPEEADKDKSPDAVEIPKSDFFPLWKDVGWTSESLAPAREFLFRRGFSRADMTTADVHAAVSGKYAGRVIIPHEDEHGEWWGFTSRLWVDPPKDGPPKVLYPPNMDRTRMYNEHVLYDVTDIPVMLVEGCLDSVWYLPLCVAALGKPTAAHFDKLQLAKRPLVIVMDGDAWEDGRALMMRLRLRGKRVGFVRLPAGEDPNSVDPVWLRDQVAKADLGEESCKPFHRSQPLPTCLEAQNVSPSTSSED